MTGKIIKFPAKHPGEGMMKVCEEAAHLIENECVRHSQEYVESQYLSLTSASPDAIEQMAVWALARMAEQNPEGAIELVIDFAEWARKEYPDGDEVWS